MFCLRFWFLSTFLWFFFFFLFLYIFLLALHTNECILFFVRGNKGKCLDIFITMNIYLIVNSELCTFLSFFTIIIQSFFVISFVSFLIDPNSSLTKINSKSSHFPFGVYFLCTVKIYQYYSNKTSTHKKYGTCFWKINLDFRFPQ